VKTAHTRYAYRYGRLGKFDCDVTRAISRDRGANKMASPMLAETAIFGVLIAYILVINTNKPFLFRKSL